MTLGSNSRFAPILALLLAVPGHSAVQPAPVDTYNIDSVHSIAGFDIAHLFVSTVHGQFNKFQGTLKLDTADIARSSVQVVIDASSISTGSEARDKDLRSPRFFDVAKYPTITFTSTSVTQVSPGSLQVAGTLDMHGVSKPVVIAVTGFGTGPGAKPGVFLAGFRKGTLQLNRSDYGMNTLVGPVGNEVDITLSMEADKVQPAN